MALKDVLKPKPESEIIEILKKSDSNQLDNVFNDAFKSGNLSLVKLIFDYTDYVNDLRSFEVYIFKSIVKINTDFFDLFEQYGIVNDENCNKFLRAAACCSEPIVKKLLKFTSADPTSKGIKSSALDLAVERENMEIVTILKNFIKSKKKDD